MRDAGHGRRLDLAWDPVDILMFVNQLAVPRAGHAGLMPSGEEKRTPLLVPRGTAIVAALQCNAVRCLFRAGLGCLWWVRRARLYSASCSNWFQPQRTVGASR